MLRFLKMDLKTHGSTPKNVKKRRKTAFLGVWNPSADPKNAVFWGRGGVPALFLSVFRRKTGLEPLRKRVFSTFLRFLRVFGSFLTPFFTFFEGFWAFFGPSRKGPKTGFLSLFGSFLGFLGFSGFLGSFSVFFSFVLKTFFIIHLYYLFLYFLEYDYIFKGIFYFILVISGGF